ncbi:hypothetical protein PVL29_008876 [Vitis rotundifolia]|uniref:Uncharacterized protein n=1 Tax=Vitis rotundifolia TaxID=103349 RepID=A0AA38ZXS6_VITRO|nr:hypothetical protein PVL29_008876 [Vitis rotundifolia]
MGFTSRKLGLLVVLFSFTLLSAWSFRELEAMRLLGGGQWAKRNSLVLQSLQKGPVLPSGPNPCTHIPEQRMLPWLPLLRMAMTKITALNDVIIFVHGSAAELDVEDRPQSL